MGNKELFGAYVKERTSKLGNYPKIVEDGMETISGDIPFKLKLSITLSELITFSSHLRKNIRLHDGTLVPCNAIVFALSASGTSKDKSLSTLRKSLSDGYEIIEERRKQFAEQKARNKARMEGEDEAEWPRYYVPPKPLQAGLGTVEGLIQHFADIAANPIGAGSIQSSEIGSELQTNAAMVDLIKTISVAYDLGNIPPKIVKSNENQTPTVKSLPVNALFFGSQEGLLFNNEIKNKFRLVFNTQLARRSLFSFTPDLPPKISVSSVDQLYAMRERERERVMKCQEKLRMATRALIENADTLPVELSNDAQKLFDVYLEYNSVLSDEMSNKYPISQLSRKHKQWLALKLAGNYSILSGDNLITEENYAYAINTVEFLAGDLTEFEKEMVKEPYEQLSDYCKMKAEDGKFFMSLHELKKMYYITGNGASKSKVEEICRLANSYDEEGTYEVREGGIHYSKIVKTDIVGVSFKIFDTDRTGQDLKDYMNRNSASGYEFYRTDFDELKLLLEENAVYSSFGFHNGIRDKENLINGTKFIILDIDKSLLTDEEAHLLLEEYNHYIVRTSDPDNEFKFRVVLELDSIVDINERMWKFFLQEVAAELGLTIDLLPQSQIFLSFKDRKMHYQLEGKPLPTKYLLENAYERFKNKPEPTSKLPPKVKQAQLDDPRETFNYAFEASQGERSNKMYRALAHAADLGGDGTYIKALAHEINNYWVVPMDEDRLERTLITPALRRI